MALIEGFKVVKIATFLEALVIKSRLEVEGIPVQLLYDSAVKLYGITVDGLGEVKILVPVKFVSKVKKILDENTRNR